MQWLRVDGTVGPHEPFSMTRCREVIGDMAALYALADGRYLVCDDDGYDKDLPVNVQASRAYQEAATRQTAFYVLGEAFLTEPGEVT